MRRGGGAVGRASQQSFAAVAKAAGVPGQAMLRQARESGQLNISNRELGEIPAEVYAINTAAPESASAGAAISFDSKDEKWWSQTEITKLIAASNKIKTLSVAIAQLSSLVTLDLHDNVLADVPDELGELTALVSLNLSHNTLAALPPSLGNLVVLRVLHMEHNVLGALPTTLGSLVALEELDVSHNKLSSLPDCLTSLRRLRKLNLSSNSLAALPDAIGRLVGLEDLDAHNNALTVLPPSVNGLVKLARVDLRHNSLKQLPPITGLTAMRELYVGNNELATLGGDAPCLPPGLHVLDVRDNRLREIPLSTCSLAHLERLDLTNNDINTLPPQLGLLKLHAILLDGNPLRTVRRDVVSKGTQAILKHLRNQISAPEDESEPGSGGAAASASSLPASSSGSFGIGGGGGGGGGGGPHGVRAGAGLDLVFSNKKATVVPAQLWEPAQHSPVNSVDLSRNLLAAVPPELSSCGATLKTLNLSFNKLTVFPGPTLASLTHLVSLDLRNNSISTLPDELALLVGLRDIAISFNRFSTLPQSIFALVALNTLVASDNQLVTVDALALGKLKELKCLDVSNNNISNVPPELGLLTGLSTLKLEGNSFKTPRPAQLAQGTRAVLEYLRSRIVT